MPPDDISRPSLTEVAEGPLHDDLPPRAAQDMDDLIDEGSVTRIEEAFELGSSPPWRELDRRIKRLCHGSHVVETDDFEGT